MEIKPTSAVAWLPPFALWILFLNGVFLLADPAGWLADPGVGWHLKSGQLILESGRLPAEDPFSYTRPGVPWMNYQWGFHVFLGLLQKAGGLALVVGACSFLYALPPVLLMRRMMRDGADLAISGFLTLLVWMVMMQHTYARPHLFTYLFFAAYVGAFARHDRDAGPGFWKCLAPLPIIMLFWCNLHGGFTAGLALLGIHAGMGVFDAIRKGGIEERKRAGNLAAVFGACAIASLANPYGWNLHRHIWDYLGREGTARMHEFLPVWHHHSLSVAAFYVLALVWLILVWRKLRTLSTAEFVAGWFFLFYAASAVRHIVLFALLATPLLARALPLVHPRLKSMAEAQCGSCKVFALWLGLASLLWLALPRLHPEGWPVDLTGLNLGANSTRVLDEKHSDLVPVFNSDHVGGALIYRYYPAIPVFMDDRTDFYDSAFIDGVYLATLEAREGWRERLDRYAVRGVVIKRGTELGKKLRGEPGWRLLAEDPQSEVFQRISPLP